MNRKFFRFWLLALLWGPVNAWALEIGEIQVQSALNQLFDARIPLPTLTPEDLAKVSVKLAPPPMFNEFGLERAPTLANLVFSIEYNAEGQVYVRVVSTRPIREPSLALLLEFGWPRGKTFREFTVFLDPVQRLAKRPGDRSRTVMDPTPVAAAPAPVVATSIPDQSKTVMEPVPVAAAPAPAVATAIPETGNSVPPDHDAAVEPVPVMMAAAPEPAPIPINPPPDPVRIYRPGDTYGPVAPGEGLWGIALKVRPDPGVTRDQMMQALFQANPQAFGKSGIGGLKIGAVLRIPTLREIADFTGSPVARQLAAPASTVTLAEGAASKAAPAAPEAALAGKAGPDFPEVFPLPPPDLPEPTAVVVTISGIPPKAAPAIAEPDQPKPEPVVAATPSAPPAAEPAVLPAIVAPEPVASRLEPVSAMPLLSLAVAEMIAAAAPVSSAALAWTTVGGPPVSEKALSEPALEIAAPLPVVEAVTVIPPTSAMTDGLKAAPAPIDAFGLLTEIEQRIPPSVFELLPPVQRSGRSVTTAVAPTDQPAPPAPLLEPPALEMPPTPPVASAALVSSEYGPVAANERLWDIAARVRPDPGISKEQMMRALFKANPQAFSKPGNMDSLKVGVMLRIPALREIVDYTGSKAAKQLLEQQRQPDVAIPAVPEPAASDQRQ
ncbi:MAG: hypothetical protein JNK95_03380 [Candidatus Competibacter sp.]|nr:hypothetical protein [Candidatus Competibacter sp.]MDG4607355.1 FimV/HubP family polar landmark protein [Candidatus Contendobacter sp.]HRD50545.1 FimV/HubP family polar landmark protein [Candidatus Contendobacter sp.]